MIKRLESIEEQISSLKAELQQTRAGTSINTDLSPHEIRTSNSRPNPHMTKNFAPRSSGKNFVEDATGATIFLGSHSDPPAALGCRNAPGDGILSDDLFLDQIAPRMYPFTSMWGPDAGAADICRTLPDDSDVIRYVTQTTHYTLSRRTLYLVLMEHQLLQIFSNVSNNGLPFLPGAGNTRAIQFFAFRIP
jgi:hypothetical protein